MIFIYKNWNSEELLYYRPVSLTSIVCKIWVKVINKQLTDYLERRGIIANEQFGFRTGRWCVTNLLSFYSRVINIIQERDEWGGLHIFRLRRHLIRFCTGDY